MACTDEALRLAARLIIYSGDENAMRPERSCSELDLIPPAEIRELELFKEFRLVELQSRILRAHLKFKKRGLRKSRSAPARSQRIHMVGILPLKLILAENTEDSYPIIISRFNSFRSSLVLSISSAAFPTMT